VIKVQHDPLTIVGWFWQSDKYHARYEVENVNIWARMIDRNLKLPHHFMLFTDQPNGKYDSMIDVRPLWSDYHLLGNPVWRAEFPQCYVRLKAFSREFAEIVGKRYASIDLDCIVTGSLDRLLGRTEDFLIYRHPVQRTFDKAQPYNASMWLMDTGCRPAVWEDFRGRKSLAPLLDDPDKAHFLQTDQGWIAYKCGLEEKGWTADDGVIMWSWMQHKAVGLPDNARIVFFNGKVKPWNYLWIAKNYL